MVTFFCVTEGLIDSRSAPVLTGARCWGVFDDLLRHVLQVKRQRLVGVFVQALKTATKRRVVANRYFGPLVRGVSSSHYSAESVETVVMTNGASVPFHLTSKSTSAVMMSGPATTGAELVCLAEAATILVE